MVINLKQKKIHFDLRFILTYNIYIAFCQIFSGIYQLHNSFLSCIWFIYSYMLGLIFVHPTIQLHLFNAVPAKIVWQML